MYRDLPYIRLNDDVKKATKRSWKLQGARLWKQSSISCEVLNVGGNDMTSESDHNDSYVSFTPSGQREVGDENASTSSDEVVFRRSNIDLTQLDHDNVIYEVIHDYDPPADGNQGLLLRRGQTIRLLKKETGEVGWEYGECAGKLGFFPLTHVNIILEPRKIPARELTHEGERGIILGIGSFALVRKLEYKGHSIPELQSEQDKYIAVKGPKGVSNATVLASIREEAKLLYRFNHDNIIKLYGICVEEPYVGLIMEVCEGISLNRLLSLLFDSFVSVRSMVIWAEQIANGMCYLIEHHYVHRDLKTDNVLVKEKVCTCVSNPNCEPVWMKSNEPMVFCPDCGLNTLNGLTLKITDFGVTRAICDEELDRQSLNDFGTLAYLAPEAHKERKYNEASDVWSYGVILWAILTKKEPYQGLEQIGVAFMVANGGSKLEVDNKCPIVWKEIMQSCWKIEPKQRPTFKKLHQQFEDYGRDLLADNVTEEEEKRVRDAHQEILRYDMSNASDLTQIYHKLMATIESTSSILARTDPGNTYNYNTPVIPKYRKGNKKIDKKDISRPKEVRHVVSVRPNSSSPDNHQKFVIFTTDDNRSAADQQEFGTLPRGTRPRCATSPQQPLSNCFSNSSPNLNLTVGGTTLRRKNAIRKKEGEHHPQFSSVDLASDAEVVSFSENKTAHDLPAAPVGRNSSTDSIGSKLKKIIAHPFRSGGHLETHGENRAPFTSTVSNSTPNRINAPMCLTRSPVSPMPINTRSQPRTCQPPPHGSTSEEMPGSIGRHRVSPADRVVRPTHMTRKYEEDFGINYHRELGIDDAVPSPMSYNEESPCSTHERTPSFDHSRIDDLNSLGRLSPPCSQAPDLSKPSCLSMDIPLPPYTGPEYDQDPYVDCRQDPYVQLAGVVPSSGNLHNPQYFMCKPSANGTTPENIGMNLPQIPPPPPPLEPPTERAPALPPRRTALSPPAIPHKDGNINLPAVRQMAS